jgi:hypothetical protein
LEFPTGWSFNYTPPTLFWRHQPAISGLTTWWHGQALGRATLGCGKPLAPLCLISGFRDTSGKIEGLAFVSSNFENISYVTFLKHKNSRK